MKYSFFHNLFLIALIFVTCISCEETSHPSSRADTFDRSVSSILKTQTKGKYLNTVPSEWSGVDFKNQVKETNVFNHISYTPIYNGSGVAVGDLNGDGLVDLFFGGNSAEDKLYFNKGGFKFEDVTQSSGILPHADGWTFGVNFVDVNGDGWLDIYVCKAGDGQRDSTLHNTLFINNQDGTFNEEASKYGIDSNDYSVQSSFFDYDLDGDLDMYLLNHPNPGGDKNKSKSLKKYVQDIKSGKLRTDVFYENVNGKFVAKTDEAQLVNYGYKNAMAVGDFNQDGYPDLYVSTDYIEPDLYYQNNKNGTFSNTINNTFKHITYYSMGSDAADINNDGLLDLYVTDMTPSDHIRSKQYMASMDTKKFNAFVNVGFHHQYMVNTLQLNNGNNTFSEIAQLSGIAKTDWSWSPLFFDIDLDGNKDLFITNGIQENVNDNDLNVKIKAKQKVKQRSLSLQEFLETMPTEIVPNQIFKNKGDLTFKDQSNSWINQVDFNSNGAAYADLDNDGDLDLVVNNMDAVASIYENSSTNDNAGNMIGFSIKGSAKNKFGLGTKITIPLGDKTYLYEHYPSKGYLSSMDYNPIIGLGKLDTIPSIVIEWPNNTVSTLQNVPVNQRLEIDYELLKREAQSSRDSVSQLNQLSQIDLNIDYRHKEDTFDDFKEQILLPYSQSKNGPFTITADVNNDGLDDLYIGGASGQSGQLFIQDTSGRFSKTSENTWTLDSLYEDLDAVFIDFDTDGDLDLYVTSGGAAFAKANTIYQDRLYENHGNGKFTKTKGVLPTMNTSTQVVRAHDIDNDGDQDLFVGGRVIPDQYPYSPDSYILRNDNGKFKDVTDSVAPDIRKSGLITGALFSDYDQDGDADLIVSGEWTEVQFFENLAGKFALTTIEGVKDTRGIWFSSEAIDLDGDGDDDYLFGNLGMNTKFSTKDEKEFHVFCDDFDNNGTYDVYFSKDYKGNLVPMRGRECSSQQMPFILDKFETYESFANASLSDIIGDDELENALHYAVKDFRSMALINQGNGAFKKIVLPNLAQVSPIMDFESVDINKDGQKEIIAVGNLYPAEVETTRFDASNGTILTFSKQGFSVLPNGDLGFYANKDVKDITLMNTKDDSQLLILGNNNDLLDIYAIE